MGSRHSFGAYSGRLRDAVLREGNQRDAADGVQLASAHCNRTYTSRPAAHLSCAARAVAAIGGGVGLAEDPTMNGERTLGDHDQAYTFGRPPSTYLAPREMARLLILRSQLREHQSVDLADRARGARNAR